MRNGGLREDASGEEPFCVGRASGGAVFAPVRSVSGLIWNSDFGVKNEIFLTVFSARSAATAAKLPSVRQRRLERQQAGQKNQKEISSFFPEKSEFHIRPETERTGAKTAPPEARPTQNGSSPDAGCGLRGLYGFVFGGYIFLKRQLEITRF